ncbi:MAG: hypothetical protein RIQ81_2590 [Pseudomonadota bacterium]|jgi:hypothetical protein
MRQFLRLAVFPVLSAVCVVASEGAFAQEVTAEKRASAQDILTNAYSKVEFRHGLNLSMKGDKVENVTPRMEARPIIGTRLLNGRLDTSVTFGAIKNADSAEFTQRNPEIIAELTAVDAKNFSFVPYIDLNTPFQGKGTTGKLAATTTVKSNELPNALGMVTLSASVEPAIETASRPGFAPVDNKAGRPAQDLGLVYNEEDSTAQTVKREPNLSNEATLSVSFKPANLSAMTASVTGFVDTEWAPKYEAVSVDGEEGVAVRKSGYKVTNTTFNRLRLTYAVNDRVLLINDTLQYIDGVYAKGVDGKRWENVARLSYTLF